MSDFPDPHDYMPNIRVTPLYDLRQTGQHDPWGWTLPERECSFYESRQLAENLISMVPTEMVCRRGGSSCPRGATCPIVRGWRR